MCFFVQTNHTRKELLFLMFKEINLRNHSSLHKLFYSLLKSKTNNYYLVNSFNKGKKVKLKYDSFLKAYFKYIELNVFKLAIGNLTF